MSICEICGLEVMKTQECKECDSNFCEECGDEKTLTCYDCQGWTEDPEEED